MHYRKGQTIPSWIGKARNKAHQGMMTFNVPVDIRGKTIRALKSAHNVIDISVPSFIRKKFAAKFRNIYIICKYPTDLVIYFNWKNIQKNKLLRKLDRMKNC